MTPKGPLLQRSDYIGRGRSLYAQCRASCEMPLHSHDYFELEILLEGEGEMDLNGRRCTLKPGSVYFLTPADFHRVTLSADNRLWNVSFDGTVLHGEQAERLFSLSNAFRTVSPEILYRLDRAAALLPEEPDPAGQSLLIEYLLRTAGLWEDPPSGLSPVRRAVLYVETLFRESPSLQQTAAHVGLSPSYFGTCFRKETGMTYVDYLNRRKVTCAAMLLNNGATVTEACFASGFGSLTGFRYAFRKTEGMSPREYAALHRHKKSPEFL